MNSDLPSSGGGSSSSSGTQQLNANAPEFTPMSRERLPQNIDTHPQIATTGKQMNANAMEFMPMSRHMDNSRHPLVGMQFSNLPFETRSTIGPMSTLSSAMPLVTATAAPPQPYGELRQFPGAATVFGIPPAVMQTGAPQTSIWGAPSPQGVMSASLPPPLRVSGNIQSRSTEDGLGGPGRVPKPRGWRVGEPASEPPGIICVPDQQQQIHHVQQQPPLYYPPMGYYQQSYYEEAVAKPLPTEPPPDLAGTPDLGMRGKGGESDRGGSAKRKSRGSKRTQRSKGGEQVVLSPMGESEVHHVESRTDSPPPQMQPTELALQSEAPAPSPVAGGKMSYVEKVMATKVKQPGDALPKSEWVTIPETGETSPATMSFKIGRRPMIVPPDVSMIGALPPVQMVAAVRGSTKSTRSFMPSSGVGYGGGAAAVSPIPQGIVMPEGAVEMPNSRAAPGEGMVNRGKRREIPEPAKIQQPVMSDGLEESAVGTPMVEGFVTPAEPQMYPMSPPEGPVEIDSRRWRTYSRPLIPSPPPPPIQQHPAPPMAFADLFGRRRLSSSGTLAGMSDAWVSRATTSGENMPAIDKRESGGGWIRPGPSPDIVPLEPSTYGERIAPLAPSEREEKESYLQQSSVVEKETSRQQSPVVEKEEPSFVAPIEEIVAADLVPSSGVIEKSGEEPMVEVGKMVEAEKDLEPKVEEVVGQQKMDGMKEAADDEKIIKEAEGTEEAVKIECDTAQSLVAEEEKKEPSTVKPIAPLGGKLKVYGGALMSNEQMGSASAMWKQIEEQTREQKRRNGHSAAVAMMMHSEDQAAGRRSMEEVGPPQVWPEPKRDTLGTIIWPVDTLLSVRMYPQCLEMPSSNVRQIFKPGAGIGRGDRKQHDFDATATGLPPRPLRGSPSGFFRESPATAGRLIESGRFKPSSRLEFDSFTWRDESPPMLQPTAKVPSVALVEDEFSKRQREEKEKGDKRVIVVRKLRGLLNKLTLEKFDQIFREMLDVGISQYGEVEDLIKLVAEKAMMQHNYIPMYTMLVGRLDQELDPALFEDETEEVDEDTHEKKDKHTFRYLILQATQESFQKYQEAPQLSDDMNEEDKFEALLSYKRRMNGNLMFANQLIANGLMKPKAGFQIIDLLTANPGELQIEALAAFLQGFVAGHAHKPAFQQRRPQLMDLTNSDKLSTRVRFLLLNALEQRGQAGAAPTPMTLEQVRTQATEKQQGSTGGMPTTITPSPTFKRIPSAHNVGRSPSQTFEASRTSGVSWSRESLKTIASRQSGQLPPPSSSSSSRIVHR